MDTTSTGTQKRITKLAIGALIAPEIPHVPGIGINPHNILILVVSDILMDPVFGEIFQEFSIEQGVIDTQKEPELGLSGNRGRENAQIRGVVNLGSAMVRGGFFKEGDILIVIPWNFQDEKCDIIYRYTGPQVEWLRRNKYL